MRRASTRPLPRFHVLAVSAAATLVVAVLVLADVGGWEYYRAPIAARGALPAHRLLRPSGALGQALGVTGFALMLVPLAYAARKRLGPASRLGRLDRWLAVHIFCGPPASPRPARRATSRGTPRECFPCHQSAYDQTRNPNHRAAGFPTSCEACHRASDGSWDQGRFTHTWFPITSGRHAGNPCSACHQDPNNYRSFTCLTCHGRSETDREHRGRSGYRYESAACYACHPNGRGD